MNHETNQVFIDNLEVAAPTLDRRRGQGLLSIC